MQTKQLKKPLRSHRDTQKIFKDVYASDKLPRIPKQKTLALIANTDPSHKPGQHWVAVFFNKTTVYYFDSYGRSPTGTPFQKLMTYRKRKKNVWEKNTGRRTCLWILLLVFYSNYASSMHFCMFR